MIQKPVPRASRARARVERADAFTVRRRMLELDESGRRLAEFASMELNEDERRKSLKSARNREVLVSVGATEVVLRDMIDSFSRARSEEKRQSLKQQIVSYIKGWRDTAEHRISHQFIRDFLISAFENTREYLHARKPDKEIEVEIGKTIAQLHAVEPYEEIDRELRETAEAFRKVVNLPRR